MRHIGRRLFRRLRGVAYGDSSTATGPAPDVGVERAPLVARPTRRRRVSIIFPFVAAALLAVAAFGSNELPSLHPRVQDASASLYSTTYTFGTENSWVRVQNIGGAPASVTVSYYNEAGQLLGQDGCPSGSCGPIGPGQGWTFFQASKVERKKASTRLARVRGLPFMWPTNSFSNCRRTLSMTTKRFAAMQL